MRLYWPLCIYAGPEICARSHVDSAKTQAQTAMANTWRGPLPRAFGQNFNARVAGTQGAHRSYQVRIQGKHLECTLALPNGAALVLPVEVVVGGRRNGFSFLERIDKVIRQRACRFTRIRCGDSRDPGGCARACTESGIRTEMSNLPWRAKHSGCG
jgi:hypothetical protein